MTIYFILYTLYFILYTLYLAEVNDDRPRHPLLGRVEQHRVAHLGERCLASREQRVVRSAS